MKARLFVALLTVALVTSLPILVANAQVKQPAEWITAKRLTVATRADVGETLTAGSLAVAGTINGTGNAAFDGTVIVNGSDLVVASTLAIAPQTAISLTNGGVITPTGTIQELTSASNVTVTLASPNSGDTLVLLNVANVSILIQDTTGQVLATDATLGQWDTLTLVGRGTSWIELARSNN